MSARRTGHQKVRLARVALAALAASDASNADVHGLVADRGPVATLTQLLETGSVSGDLWARAASVLDHSGRIGAQVLIPEDSRWPPQFNHLRRLDDSAENGGAPLCLWMSGHGPLDDALAQSVAVVGTRRPTSYGSHMAADIGQGLAERGWSVVSGAAYGVDSFALRGALSAGGRCVVILPCGVDQINSLSTGKQLELITATGLLISQWPPGTPALQERFVASNRLIAAAARGAVMVEGTKFSGALRTLNHALLLGRAVMVVPGQVTSPTSAGGHQFLRSWPQARLVSDAAEVVKEVEANNSSRSDRQDGPRP